MAFTLMIKSYCVSLFYYIIISLYMPQVLIPVSTPQAQTAHQANLANAKWAARPPPAMWQKKYGGKKSNQIWPAGRDPLHVGTAHLIKRTGYHMNWEWSSKYVDPGADFWEFHVAEDGEYSHCVALQCSVVCACSAVCESVQFFTLMCVCGWNLWNSYCLYSGSFFHFCILLFAPAVCICTYCKICQYKMNLLLLIENVMQ